MDTLSIFLCLILPILRVNCLVESDVSSFEDSVNLHNFTYGNLSAKFIEPLPEEPAGFRARITQKALDYATKIAIDVLMSQIPYVQIPDVKETVASADVNIKRIKIEKFDRPESSITTTSGYGVTWKMWALNTHVSANYDTLASFGFFEVQKVGTVDIKTDDLSFTIELIIGRDIYGRPTTMTTNCDSGGDLIIEFKGGWEDILNMGSAVFGNSIRSLIVSQICSQLQTAIDENFDIRKGIVQKNSSIVGLYDFNFGLTKYPDFNDDYLETSHRGVSYFLGERVEPPFNLSEIPPFQNHTNKMMYAYVSDFVLNSALYATFLSGMMQFYVTNDLVQLYAPEEVKQVLSSSCEFPALCLGTIFPGLPQRHPDATVEIKLSASQCPEIKFYDGHSVAVSAWGNADFFVKKVDEVLPAFSINFSLHVDVSLKVENGSMFFEVNTLKPAVGIVSSNIGDVGTGFFYETIIRVATQTVILPKLAEMGKKGVKLPKSIIVQLTNPEIMVIKEPGVFVVATDITVDLPPDLNLIEMFLGNLTNQTSVDEEENPTTTPLMSTTMDSLFDFLAEPSSTASPGEESVKRTRGSRRKGLRNRNENEERNREDQTSASDEARRERKRNRQNRRRDQRKNTDDK